MPWGRAAIHCSFSLGGSSPITLDATRRRNPSCAGNIVPGRGVGVNYIPKLLKRVALDRDGYGGATPCVEREVICQLGDLAADAVESRVVVAVVEGGGDPGGDLAHLRLLHAAGGERGSADADARRLEGWIDVVGDGVLVDSDAGLAESEFSLRAENAFLEDVDQHEVVVSASGDDAEASLLETESKHLGIGDDLRGVGLELGPQGFRKGHGFSRDNVHERATLLAGEDGLVNVLANGLLGLFAYLVVDAAEDKAGAGSTESLVGGSGGNVRVRHG